MFKFFYSITWKLNIENWTLDIVFFKVRQVLISQFIDKLRTYRTSKAINRRNKMADITAKDRIEATFRGEYLDRVPVNTNCFRTEYIADKLGYTRMELLTESDKELKALQLAQEEFPSDIIRVPADPTLPESITARRELKEGPDAPSRPKMLEDKAKLQGLEARDPRESWSYKPYLDMTSRMKDMFPDIPVMALTPGVWSNAAEMRGTETFLFDTADDPDFIHGVLRFTTDLAKARGEALAESGADMIVFGDPSAGCSLISPKIYKEFVKPYHKELTEYLKEKITPLVGFHICGFTDPIMEDIASMPLDWFEIDSPSSMEKMKGLAKDKITVKGNVPTNIFAEGTEDDMADAVKACIDIGAPGGNFILAPGCAIPWNMKPENMKAFCQATERYGNREYIQTLS